MALNIALNDRLIRLSKLLEVVDNEKVFDWIHGVEPYHLRSSLRSEIDQITTEIRSMFPYSEPNW